MKTFIFALLIISSSAYSDEWSRSDTYRETAYLTLHTIDWMQTREISRNPNYYEQNNILGSHPTIQEVDRYFAVTAIAHLGISYIIPVEYRVPFQYISIGVEFGAVAHNYSIGVSARF